MGEPPEPGQPDVRHDDAAHRFEIWSGDELAGFTVYEPSGDRRVFVHTEIDDRFSGLGLASDLVRAALTATREAGLLVVPLCPFVRRYVQRHREFADLVPGELRLRFGLPGDDRSSY